MNNQHPERLDAIAATKAARKTRFNFITALRKLENRCLVHLQTRHRRECRVKPGLAVAAFTYLYLLRENLSADRLNAVRRAFPGPQKSGATL